MCHSEKAQWVEKHLGSYWLKKLIITKDKTVVYGNVLIDDKHPITGALKPMWDQIVYDQPYNVIQFPDVKLFNWSHWVELKEDFKTYVETLNENT